MSYRRNEIELPIIIKNSILNLPSSILNWHTIFPSTFTTSVQPYVSGCTHQTNNGILPTFSY